MQFNGKNVNKIPYPFIKILIFMYYSGNFVSPILPMKHHIQDDDHQLDEDTAEIPLHQDQSQNEEKQAFNLNRRRSIKYHSADFSKDVKMTKCI